MFTKTEPMTSSSAPSVPNAARPGGNSKSILAADLRITGEISSSGQIEILGEVEGNVAGPLSLIYHKAKHEAGIVTASAWSPILKKNIAIASLVRPYGERVVDDLWVEIYALRELNYQKLMKRVKIVPRPFLKLARRAANPPGLT